MDFFTSASKLGIYRESRGTATRGTARRQMMRDEAELPAAPGFGEKLRQARKMRGLGVRDLAATMEGLSAAAISKHERGERTPRREAIEKYADALNWPLDDLLDAAGFKKEERAKIETIPVPEELANDIEYDIHLAAAEAAQDTYRTVARTLRAQRYGASVTGPKSE